MRFNRFLVVMVGLVWAVSSAAQTSFNAVYHCTNLVNSQAVKNARVILSVNQPILGLTNFTADTSPIVGITDSNGVVTFTNVTSGYSYQFELDLPYKTIRRTNGFPAGLTGTIAAEPYDGIQFPGNVPFAYFNTNAPVSGNISPLGTDINAASHSITNATTVQAPNLIGSATSATNAGTAMIASNLLGTLPAAQITGQIPQIQITNTGATHQIFNAPYMRLSTPPAGSSYYGTPGPFAGALYVETSMDASNWTSITPYGQPVFTDSYGMHDASIISNASDGYIYAFFTHQPASLGMPANDFLVAKSGPGLTNITSWTAVATPAMTNDGVSWIWVPRPINVHGTNYVFFTIGSDGAFHNRQLWLTTANSTWTTYSTPMLLATNENNINYPNGGIGDPFWLGTISGTNYVACQNIAGSLHYDLYYCLDSQWPTQMHLIQTNIVTTDCEAGGVFQPYPGVYRFQGSSYASQGPGTPLIADSTSPIGPWSPSINLNSETPFATFPHGTGRMVINGGQSTKPIFMSVNVQRDVNAGGNGMFGSASGSLIQVTSTSGFGPNIRLQYTGAGGHNYYIGTAGPSDGIGTGTFFVYDQTLGQFVFKIDTSGNPIYYGNPTFNGTGSASFAGNASFGSASGSFISVNTSSGFGPALRLNYSGSGGHNYYNGTAGPSDGIGTGTYYVYDVNNGKFEFTIDPNGHAALTNDLTVNKYVVYRGQATGPTASQIGAGNSAIWTSNSTPPTTYVSYTSDGSTLTVKQLAP